MNSASLVSIESPPLPPRVVTDWRRFSSGSWRVPEGDIQAAYCADTFPKIKVFTHEGRLFTNCCGHFSGPIRAASDCYPVVPADEYHGPEPRRYTYEGREATYRGEVFKLGPKVVFEASDPTVDEWRQLFRVLYADGGDVRARRHLSRIPRPTALAQVGERTRRPFQGTGRVRFGAMPRTQAEMRQLLEGEEAASTRPAVQQLDFTL